MAFLTGRDELTAVASGDFLHIIDVSDTATNAAGASKKIQVENLIAGPYAYIHKVSDAPVETECTLDTPVQLANIVSASVFLKDFTTDNLGALTYTGTRSFIGLVHGYVTGGRRNGEGSGSKEWNLDVYKGGSVIRTGDGLFMKVDQAQQAFPVIFQCQIDTSDVFTYFLTNTTDNIDWDTYKFNMQISWLRWA